MILNLALLGLVTLQRAGELWLAKRNTRRLVAMGAREFAPGHYPLIIAVHSVWLISLWLLAIPRPLHLFWLVLFCVIEVLRVWVLATLAERWTTRIIVLPEAPLVRSGPYRWTNHPNYLVVILEILVLPLVFGLWQVAIVFTLLNAAVLAVRIRAEDRALGRKPPVVEPRR